MAGRLPAPALDWPFASELSSDTAAGCGSSPSRDKAQPSCSPCRTLFILGTKLMKKEINSRKVRIVVVEDNPGDVFLLEKSLQARNLEYELIRYDDVEQAVHALCVERAVVPDLILVDLNLPRREGFDVLKAARQTPWLVGVPVGVLTSSEAARDRHRTALIGAERYIHKPPTLDEFIDSGWKSCRGPAFTRADAVVSIVRPAIAITRRCPTLRSSRFSNID